jgi:hypothetical protein
MSPQRLGLYSPAYMQNTSCFGVSGGLNASINEKQVSDRQYLSSSASGGLYGCLADLANLEVRASMHLSSLASKKEKKKKEEEEEEQEEEAV